MDATSFCLIQYTLYTYPLGWLDRRCHNSQWLGVDEILWLELGGRSCQVPFRIRALYSSDMAWCHFGSLSACAHVMGSRSEFLDNEVWIFSFWRGSWMLFLALVCMGWFDWVAVGRLFVVLIWGVWFWVMVVLSGEVSESGVVTCVTVGASLRSCWWGPPTYGGMSVGVTVLSLIIGGGHVETVDDSGGWVCVRVYLKGKIDSINLTCLETKFFNIDGS